MTMKIYHPKQNLLMHPLLHDSNDNAEMALFAR